MILRKPGRLTDEEYAVVKMHSSAGAQMVAGLGDGELARIVRHHHERLDGMGYPDGLAGDAIPLGARIIAVADTFDALTSKRPYRAGMSHKAALAVLSAEAGTQLDRDAVRAFLTYYSGHRLVALWALLANGSQRLTSSLTGELNVGGAATAAKVSVAALATAVAGSAVVQSPGAGQQPAGFGSSGAVAREARLVSVSTPRPRQPERMARAIAGGGRGSAEMRVSGPDGRSAGARSPGSEPGASPVAPGESTGSPEQADPAGGGGSSPSLPKSTGAGPIKSALDTVEGLANNVVPLPPVPDVKSVVPKLPKLPNLPIGGTGPR